MFLTELSTWKWKDTSFWDLNRPDCRASPSGRGYDTPSSPKHKFRLVLDDLLLKSENLYAALDWEVMCLTEISTWKLEHIFLDLNRSDCRASPSGRDYDTPSSPKPRF